MRVRRHQNGLNPLDTNLVVADLSRTEKTICLAVTPSLKSYGISGRARLFEVIQRVKEVNAQRQRNTPGRQFTGASSHDPEVRRNPSLALDYIVAPPRMAHYIDWSTRVYSVYLKHVAPEDIYPYSKMCIRDRLWNFNTWPLLSFLFLYRTDVPVIIYTRCSQTSETL